MFDVNSPKFVAFLSAHEAGATHWELGKELFPQRKKSSQISAASVVVNALRALGVVTYSNMPGRISADELDEFRRWKAAQKSASAPSLVRAATPTAIGSTCIS